MLGTAATGDAGSDADPGEPDRERSGVRAGPGDTPCFVEQQLAVALVGRQVRARTARANASSSRPAPRRASVSARAAAPAAPLGPARGGEQRRAGEMRQCGYEVFGDAGVGVPLQGERHAQDGVVQIPREVFANGQKFS